jgi:hypothetical protein
LEESLGELKTMVFEILLESKKPLMAKKIAFNIYRKYDGYRMSRFMVRDILWKELKNEIEYDNVNYTYSVKEEYKNIVKINEYVNNESLLIPLIYKIPFKKSLFRNYAYYSSEYKKNLNYDLTADYENLSIQKWIEILECLKKRHDTIGNLKENDSFLILKENLKNPIFFYSLLIDTNKYESNIYFENNVFQKIFNEITRDNIITEAEENYLLEKAKDLTINTDYVKKAILRLDFKAYNSFKILIDEICEDGIITPAETLYIEEKSTQYNVDKALLKTMIEAGLKKNKFIKENIGNPLFYEYLKCLFSSISLRINVDNEFYDLYHDIGDIDNYLKLEIQMMSKEIHLKLKKDLFLDIDEFDIDKFLNFLGVKLISHEESIKIFHKKEILTNDAPSNSIISLDNSFKIKQNSLEKIRINNTEFKVKKNNLPFFPLFANEFNRESGDNIIIINTSHKLYVEESENLIIKIATSLFFTKSTMTDPNISRFIERITNNLELIEDE